MREAYADMHHIIIIINVMHLYCRFRVVWSMGVMGFMGIVLYILWVLFMDFIYIMGFIYMGFMGFLPVGSGWCAVWRRAASRVWVFCT
jgi:hypothetical protein